MSSTDDETYMAMALALGLRGQGTTWPNPSVGCVLVKDGRVVGRGWTQSGGRPHAETEALRRAGAHAQGATAYVTLEPCSNFGRTPPCTKALIESGVARVVAGCVDPDPRVNGKGLEGLRQAGIDVETGVLGQACIDAHKGLYSRILLDRPAVTLKLAQSLDGRIALGNGQSKWLTGGLARLHAHRLRAEHDAILIGSGTALADDPTLDCRIEGLEVTSPIRIVLDRRARLKPSSKLAQSAHHIPLWVFSNQERPDLQAQGAEIFAQSGSIPDILSALANRGITRLLIEGGATIAAAFLRLDLVERLELFTCPKLLGGDSTPAIADLGLSDLAQTHRWRHIDQRRLEQDQLNVYGRIGGQASG